MDLRNSNKEKQKSAARANHQFEMLDFLIVRSSFNVINF